MPPKRIQSIDKSLLYNRYVLYFVFIVAVGNLLALFAIGDMNSAVVFVIVGFLTSFFSKNMVVILCVCMAVTNILKYGAARYSEGFKEEDDENKEAYTEEEEGTNEEPEKEENGGKKKQKTENMESSENIDKIVAKYSAKADAKKAIAE